MPQFWTTREEGGSQMSGEGVHQSWVRVGGVSSLLFGLANTHPTLMHPLTGHLGTPFFPGGPELWHHPLAYSAAAELPGAALQHATLVHPALHPQVPVRSYL
jgi:hypothetical protein